MPVPKRTEIHAGARVQIVEKQNQRTGALTEGIVSRILTSSPTHPHGIKVVLSSVLPVNNYTERSKLFFPLRSPTQILELNAWIKDYCTKSGCVYLDYFSAMVDDKGMLKADLARDGLHPNDQGYAIMAPLAQKAIDEALAK